MSELAKFQEPLPQEYESLSYDALKQRLQLFIENLLAHDFEKLCHMIYRHDVLETKFQRAMQLTDIGEQAAAIADLVIQREMEKVASRQAYRKEKEEKQQKKRFENPL